MFFTRCGQTNSENSAHENLSQNNSEAILNQEAGELYSQAQKESKNGLDGWDKALELYNKADELEPENPLILHARAQLKIDSKLDVDGGFEDHAAAIKFSKDSFNLKMRYSNRALDFLQIKDVCAACADWERAGDAQNYLDKYCNRDFANAFPENSDDQVELFLSLEDTIGALKISRKTIGVSQCNGLLSIVNNSIPQIIIKNGYLDFNHEVGSESTLFLQAKDSNGAKVHFFKEVVSKIISSNANDTLIEGFVYQHSLDIMQHHYFPYVGAYSVRIGLRPSANIQGIEHAYYSNWVEIEVVESDYSHVIHL